MKGEPISHLDALLFAGVVFFALMLLGISKWSPSDGQTFQAIASVLSGLVGAFLARIKPGEKQLPPDSVIRTATTTVTPPAEVKP